MILKRFEHKNKDKCLRCGRCCVVYDYEHEIFITCRYLICYNTGKTRCMIYPHRVGAINGKNQYCHLREEVEQNFPGCPYNKQEYPMHPAYKDDQLIVEEA